MSAYERIGYTMTRASDGAPILRLIRDTSDEVIEEMEHLLKGSYATHCLSGGKLIRVTVRYEDQQ